MKKRLFIASTVEGLDVAYAMQENLEFALTVTVWSQGFFELSKTTIESLFDRSRECDGAAFVFTPDDMTIIREKTVPSVRDNVIFELGLFVGSLGREQCYIVKPRSFSSLDLPTDLLGVTTADYDDEREDENLVAALGPTANKIRRSLVPKAPKEKPKPKTLMSLVTSKPFRLIYNPETKRSKPIVFGSRGVILEGNNKNEHRWRVKDGKLELIQLDGQVHSRFEYDEDAKLFRHTNDVDTLSIRDQVIVPESPANDV